MRFLVPSRMFLRKQGLGLRRGDGGAARVSEFDPAVTRGFAHVLLPLLLPRLLPPDLGFRAIPAGIGVVAGATIGTAASAAAASRRPSFA